MMVSLDVFQFNYYVDNENARNDMKNFAEMLGKTFEQYKKLWNKYLQLRKHCEDADFKIPFQLLEPDNGNMNTILTPDTSEVASGTSMVSMPLRENVPHRTSLTLNPRVDVQSKNDDLKQKLENKLLNSPVLAKKRAKHNDFNTSDPVLVDLDKNMQHLPLHLDEDDSIVRDDIKKNTLHDESEEKENSVIDESNDQIECTPVSKSLRKLGVSKLYNVDTTLLQNGKKLRQSMLVLLPNEQSVSTEDHKVYNKLKSRVSSKPEKNEKMNKSGSLEEEIIQRSPSQNMKSRFKKRNLQLKRKFTDANDKSDRFTDESNSETKLTISETIRKSPKQKTKFCNKNIEKSSNTSLNSCAFSNAMDLPVPVQLIKEELVIKKKEIEIKNEVTQKEENMCSALPSQMLNTTSLDETYFVMEEQVMEKFNCNKNMLKGTKDNKTKQELLSKPPPVEERHRNTFHTFPEKEVAYYDKVPKKKSEREKLHGITCFECKEYYQCLGLSEEQIKAKKNQCSRHRSFFPQNSDTPEGFWNHLFPDTNSSTYLET